MSRKALGWIAAGIVLAWLLSPVVVWLASGCLPEASGERLSALGVFGDGYGAVNALFSGAALCGVVWSLVTASKERIRQDKPFLAPVLDEDHQVELRRNTVSGGKIEIPVEFNLGVLNSGDSVAINVEAMVTLDSVDISAKSGLALPVAVPGDRAEVGGEVLLTATLHADAATAMVESWKSGTAVRAKIVIRYSNLADVFWYTLVEYNLAIGPAELEMDVQILEGVLEQDGSNEVEAWPTKKKIRLLANPEMGTWKRAEWTGEVASALRWTAS